MLYTCLTLIGFQQSDASAMKCKMTTLQTIKESSTPLCFKLVLPCACVAAFQKVRKSTQQQMTLTLLWLQKKFNLLVGPKYKGRWHEGSGAPWMQSYPGSSGLVEEGRNPYQNWLAHGVPIYWTCILWMYSIAVIFSLVKWWFYACSQT